jgi:hypothetical protein
LKKAGIRNTKAVVLQEVVCLYLRYAKAHARLRLAQQPVVADPVFSPTTETFDSSASVILSTATAGADIYYTTNGDAPTTSSTKYTSAITVSATTTLKAIAVKDGFVNSAVVSKTYTKN